jgi:hypothetical protein
MQIVCFKRPKKSRALRSNDSGGLWATYCGHEPPVPPKTPLPLTCFSFPTLSLPVHIPTSHLVASPDPDPFLNLKTIEALTLEVFTLPFLLGLSSRGNLNRFFSGEHLVQATKKTWQAMMTWWITLSSLENRFPSI